MSEHQDHQEPNGLDDRFADWVDGGLDEEAQRELEAELARDPELRRQAEEYRATVQLVQGHLAQPQADEEPPGDLVGSVLERVRRERRPLFRLVPMVASLAAAAALVLMVVLFHGPTEPNRPEKMAKGDAAEVEYEEAGRAQPDDRALKTRSIRKEAGKLAKTVKPDDPDITLDTLDEAETKMEELRKKTEGKDVARVNDRLQAAKSPTTPAPGKAPNKAPAPTAPAERPGTGQELQMRSRGRGDLGQAFDGRVIQVRELRRITSRVFRAPAGEKQDQDKFAQMPRAAQKPEPKPEPKPDAAPDAKTGAKLRRVAEKKNKAADAENVAQVPLVVVQLTAPPVSGGAEFKKGHQQRQTAQGFLGYLSQQPKSWAVGNQTFQQARAEDLSKALARPRTGAGGTGAGAAAARSLAQPGDQLLRISGTSREVEKLFQQLKEFLGKGTPRVVVQEVPEGRFPGGPTLRKYGEARRGPEEMRFYLVLRQASATPTQLPPRGGRR